MNDPVKHCSVYKEIGCSHVDGYLCDYPDCSILKDYKMNERIKELAKEAGLVADATYAKAPDAIWLREYNKKFAELIVRECAKVAWYHTPDTEELEYSHLIEDKILKHFGVK
jgi:hypothetical protein